MKGIGPVAIFLLLAIFGLSVEAIYINLFIGTRISRSIVSQEVEVLRAVNKMEMVKIGLPYALEYSFSQAVYDVLKKGGGIYLWRDYDTTSLPNLIENVEKTTLIYLNQYVDSIDSLNAIYTEVELSEEGRSILRVKATSNQDLNISSGLYSVYENPNISISINGNLFEIYDVAKRKFVQTDSVRKAIENSVEEFDCSSDNETVKNKVEEAIETMGFSNDRLTLSLNCIDIVISPNCNSTVAVEVEVKLTDKTKYIVYDKTSNYRSPQLRFFVKTSNDYSFRPL